LDSWNGRDGLGDQFATFWRLYLKFERWRASIHTGPFGLWWYGDEAQALKSRMEDALLKHPAKDVAILRIQLKLLRSKNEIGATSGALINRVSNTLTTLASGAGSEPPLKQAV
jgi:hypothetical protein